MTDFYDRKWAIEIDDELFLETLGTGPELRVTFNVINEFGSTVSYAEIIIYNLNETSRTKTLQRDKSITLVAGYQSNSDRIFRGRINNVIVTREGPNLKTRLVCIGGSQPNNNHINHSFPVNVKPIDIIRECAKAMKYGLVISDDDFNDLPAYPGGFNAVGDPSAVLLELMSAHQFDWVVEGDNIVVIKRGSARKSGTIIVREDTGMEDIPEITMADGVGVNVKMRLNPQIRIGCQIDIQSISRNFNFSNLQYINIKEGEGRGIYNVYKIAINGDTHGDQWTTETVNYRQ